MKGRDVDKYDDAIVFLRTQDASRGSYFEECASLIEELLGQLHEQQQLTNRPSTEQLAETSKGAKSWHQRNRGLPAPIDSKE